MFSPGSLLAINHPFSWYAIVKDKKTGRQWTYWMNGSQLNREAVARHIAEHYPGVEAVTIDPCTGPPTRTLQPVPPEHFQHGILKIVEQEIIGERGPVVPLLSRATLTRKTIWHRPR